MEYKLDYEKISKFVRKKYTYNRREVTYILPLSTRKDRATFPKGFMSVVGGVVRKINGQNLNIDIRNTGVEDIVDLGNYKSEESKALFSYYLANQLENLNEGRITSFKQIELIPFSAIDSEKRGEIDFAIFFFDTFIADDMERVNNILSKIDDPNLITDIMESLSLNLSSSRGRNTDSYKVLFPKLKEQFISDLESLAQNESFFLENISTLFVHYTFVAMSQTILQTNKTTQFDENNLSPVYYILHWEKAGRWRNSYTQGLSMLKNEIHGFFAHEHALNILGINTFSDKRNLFYHDIKNKLEVAGPKAEKQFIQSIYEWLEVEYKAKTSIDVKVYSPTKTLDDAFGDLVSAVKSGLSKEINSRYQLAYEAIVSKFFRKHGGSLGTLLSLDQEQLLLLVAVSVGNDRIDLKQLWEEFEQRGVWLDHHSKEEVVQVLDKLNYMEKKSDSGDAQYVKSIL